ncbi:glycosyl hydrolase family 3 N terminal domain-containing protein [Boeremia exigua]|uniref:glycosyl hydrolase family 3 N terminal domain-containing protein n=1 Tax=Boeremia exigua TaxID=749465 RepID=UPI001E8D348C|nr:glycosyl hydrolase family 3 N terminal domain-containing protein [Boeremia exigua]KAH6620181.1 glycosyl hydrolase family 3 N terminal domain-containing protein [Boeremia exigua]
MRLFDTRTLVLPIATLHLVTAVNTTLRAHLSWTAASDKAKNFLSQLNITEKAGLVTGGFGSGQPLPCVGTLVAIERLNFSGLCLSDGPAGLARSDGVSVFASGITVAATWDRDLMYKRGLALGQEFRAKGAHVHLGPSVGPLGRHARGGRNWEGFGPDPYLAGVAIYESVTGIQAVGVQAVSKHYIGNEQETQRVPSRLPDGTVIEALSANIDDRTLHELYLWPFADAIHAGTASVMCAYNRVNSSYSCANSNLLSTILKDELAFPGYVVSDWDATHSTVASANAGLDMEMPGTATVSGRYYFGESLVRAVEAGNVTEDRLEEMAVRVMTPYFRLRQDDGFPTADPSSGAVFLTYTYGRNSPLSALYPEVPARDVREDHAQGIRELGAAGTVLLKNVNSTLPLTSETSFGLFGNDLPDPTPGSVYLVYGDDAFGNEMGTLDIGGGSGTVRHTNLVSPLEAIRNKVKSLGGRVQWLFDNNEIADGRFRSVYPRPQVCLLFLKAFATEGLDRASIDFQWNATMAVESTARLCPNTIVITHGPGVVLMPWADNENVTAILAAHYPGEETGNSIVDVLWGISEPAGRLPYSIPKAESDYGPPLVELSRNITNPNAWQADYTEGQMIDYRHIDMQNNTESLYEFGFGLSYTSFEMGKNLRVELVDGPLMPHADQSQGFVPGGLADLWTTVAIVTVNVTNSGDRDGSSVPQLYVSLPRDTTPVGTPLKVLRGFEKVRLHVGETKEARFELTRRDVSYWDANEKQWVIPRGFVRFMTGFSSRASS